MKTAKEFDETFENDEDISEFVDYSKARRPNLEQNGSTSISPLKKSG